MSSISLTESLDAMDQSRLAWSSFPNFVKEAQSGPLGFTIVCVNLVAVPIFAGYLALGGALVAFPSLVAAVVVLPSIALFGPKNYLRYLPHPLVMGIGHALTLATVKVDKETGIWEGRFTDWAHFNDRRFSEGLQKFVQKNHINTMMDCGCGNGFYVKQLQAVGTEVYGCDGNPKTAELGPNFTIANLTRPNFLSENERFANRKFDCVMSLETAEHIPQKFEAGFLRNITSIVSDNGKLVLSWARKGQGGLGHVNEQNADYVLAEMGKIGWECNWEETKELRLQSGPEAMWFRNTLFVFERVKSKQD